MATATRIPLEVYLHTSYEPDAEYVDGEIIERPVGELNHAAWQKALLQFFLQYERDWRVRVYAELRVQVTDSNYRIPDVSVLDADAPREQIVRYPPRAVFEILSPEDSIQRTLAKLADYERMGIPNIWLIEPNTNVTYHFHDGRLHPSARFEGQRQFSFDFAEIVRLIQ